MKQKLLFTFFMIVAVAAHAQTTSKSKSKSASNTPTNWGIGLRLGDPTGVSAKKYLTNGKALEFNIGSSTYWGHDYRDNFYDEPKYKNYSYLGYRGNSAISIQAHYLIQKNFPGAPGLQWYWGFGPQLRFKNYSYSYRYDGGNSWIYVTEEVTNVDFGGDILIGLEYHIKDAPLSLFVDGNLFLELLDDPFMIFGQGGIGIRYNLK